jgi:hypothetical protein
MAISKSEFSALIKSFNFRELFNLMGWNNDKSSHTISVDNHNYSIQSIAEKSGFRIIVCNSGPHDIIPNYSIRKKIENQVTRLFQEHLIIFPDHKKQEQIWQFVVRQSGKPTKVTETRYHILQDPELLYQRASGVFFEMEEEGNITIVDVTRRMAENFHANADKITKQFYDHFKKEHSSFLNFIKGINEKVNKDWYASLMLNRLMFCYFIQKKGFLDNNKNYLRDKLNACQLKKGKNKFYSFYRDFLLVLFHRGLNEINQPEDVKIEIGRIPYLNGGLFDEHELEKMYKGIDIEDKAFERIFDFFDKYEWHLDTRISASGKDINPDVIGYIFEKYINDRAQMGAYYTKEDITEYISKNCIIPYLFDETKRKYPKSFKAEGPVWQVLKETPYRYIYDAVKKGVNIKLPEDIEVGISNVAQRTEWNKPAPENYALPTEIWREVVDRRNRYSEVMGKIENGEVNNINDLITYNLNIRQFAQDVIEDTEDPDYIRHFFKAISSVSILDPTCGSGAFLFAAMNILEPLYEACIMRMRAFVEDEDRLNELEQKSFSHKYKDFRLKLEEIQNEHHPNLKYYIFKSIILQNLYGVDIMKEAVEIAKLRLFLKLVATVEVDYRKPNLGLEPLPDIDFNIRAGNTLVGFGTEAELNKGLTWTFDGQLAKPIIEEKSDIVAKTFTRYKEIQLNNGNDYSDFKEAKEDLSKRLKELNHELNQLLHKQAIAIPYEKWLLSYQPFHWFAEFYDIMNVNGGFDVIIGNPPYLEIRQIDYEPKGLKTYDSGAVHNMCIERSLQILKNTGNISMIVPIALVCTQRMTIVQNLLEANRTTWYSNFAWRPGKLFENVNRALTIFVANKCDQNKVFNTNYIKWTSDTREDVFPNISFIPWLEKRNSFWVPKLGNKIEENILRKLLKSDYCISYLITKQTLNRVYYRTTGGLYWKIFTNFSPKFYINGKEGKSSRETHFAVKERDQDILCISLLSSNLFWWWYTITSNLRDLNPSDIQGFKFPSTVLNDSEIIKLGKKYLKDLEDNSTMLTRIQKQTGETQTQSFKISLSKPIIDEIDTVLAEHYGFTAEELDFIINYDIKYRMGKEMENGEED